MSSKKFISFIIPAHNEQDNILWHHEQLTNYLKAAGFNNFEIIYVDDGSTDDSLRLIQSLQGPKVRFLSFSRNFGKEAATSAGLKICRGDAAIMMDADGQHPEETIAELVSNWEKGYQVVIGVRRSNINEGLVKKYGSKLFYKVLNSFTEGNTVPGSTDFRLLDRRVIDEFNKLSERNRITRGLIDWLGFHRTFVYFSSPERHGGTPSYSVKKLVRLALHALVSQTTKPLQVMGFIGGITTILSATIGLFLAVETYVMGDPMNLAVTGTAMLGLFTSFLVGIVLICQWLLALYIESIHNETQNRPLYIISEESKT